jgi:hypothetical protein
MSARSAAAARAEGKRRAAILRAIDLDGPICECGVLIAVHPPLPSPGPLMARVRPVMGRPPRPGAFGINR